jgi:hypothetical protein
MVNAGNRGSCHAALQQAASGAASRKRWGRQAPLSSPQHCTLSVQGRAITSRHSIVTKMSYMFRHLGLATGVAPGQD